MIIDIHGHYTTEPAALHQFRDKQLAGLADPMRRPDDDRSRHHRRDAD
jgi:4-oxalmesaconate hydratase